jgi:hypothetical protein
MSSWFGQDIENNTELNESVKTHSKLSEQYHKNYAQAVTFVKKHQMFFSNALTAGAGIFSLAILGLREHGPLNRLVSLGLSGGAAYLVYGHAPALVNAHPGLFACLKPTVIEPWLKRKIVEWGIQGYCDIHKIEKSSIAFTQIHQDTMYFLDGLQSLKN